jgi:hypothetical protein
MGYITEFGERLEAMLAELPDEERRATIHFIKDELLRSYKNGLRDGKADRGRDDKRPVPNHRPKTSSR